MTNPPPTKSRPASDGSSRAALTSLPAGAVRPKDDAEGVLSALPFTVLTEDEASTAPGYGPIAWLAVQAPHRRTPTATSWCACGRDRSAVGHGKVLALIEAHTAHRDECPLRTSQEGRNAA